MKYMKYDRYEKYERKYYDGHMLLKTTLNFEYFHLRKKL